MATKATGLRNQLVHFGSRYQYANQSPRVHVSNRVFITWHHGDPQEPEFAPLFATMFEKQGAIDRVVVSNTTTRRHLVQAGWPAEKCVLLPIGVDTSHFRPPSLALRAQIREELGLAENTICIGSFQKDGAGWEEGIEPKLIKGPDVFLEVIAQVARHWKKLHVLLTGPARGYVKRGLAKIGVPYSHINLENYLDVARYYHALDLYLITSREEGGPKGLMESWASGVPVVSAAMGMPRDYIRHGENGLLAEIEHVSELAQHVIAIIEGPALRSRLTTQGLADVQPLDWFLVSAQYYDKLYKPFLL